LKGDFGKSDSYTLNLFWVLLCKLGEFNKAMFLNLLLIMDGEHLYYEDSN